MIKRYHEAPIEIFKDVQEVTDGDYALVHLFETNEEYFNMFKKAVEAGRDVILDNSIFELGTAFDMDRYAYWIRKLEPTWYIVPDCWKNGWETARMFSEFIHRYPDLPGKRIGVAQGHQLEEVEKCYRSIEKYCDMVAFNLDFSSAAPVAAQGIPYCLRMSIGRRHMLGRLFERDVINTTKPHHLLGCGVPQEVMWYPKEWTWVRSIDTCNPVIHGLLDIGYDSNLPGLLFKRSTKMCDLMDASVQKDQKDLVMHNIHMFKQFTEQRPER